MHSSILSVPSIHTSRCATPVINIYSSASLSVWMSDNFILSHTAALSMTTLSTLKFHSSQSRDIFVCQPLNSHSCLSRTASDSPGIGARTRAKMECSAFTLWPPVINIHMFLHNHTFTELHTSIHMCISS